MKGGRMSGAIEAVAVVLPVHNEEDLLAAALEALHEAMAEVSPEVECRAVIVLDGCTDGSASIARQWSDELPAMVVSGQFCNVGAARRAGCNAALEAFPDNDLGTIWLATTDADSRVPKEWLVAQVSAGTAGCDLWTGRVDVLDWSPHRTSTAHRWHHDYLAETAPVHGASMGISADMYLKVGGFRELRTGEDRDLYERAVSAGATLHLDSVAKVVTSARRIARAPLGFAHALASIEDLASHRAISRPDNSAQLPLVSGSAATGN
jgi:glycosyltransferase involved in cell wall biosynthesis